MKLVYFNARRIFDMINFDLSSDIQIFLKMFNTQSMTDRTGTIISPFNMELIYPLQKLKTEKQSYADACNDRAKKIIKMIDEKDTTIFLLWSGGVDSTTMMSAMLSHSSPQQQKKMIILLSQKSIRENEKFFKNYILGKLRYESSLHSLEKLIKSLDNNIMIFSSEQCHFYGNWWSYVMSNHNDPITIGSFHYLQLHNDQLYFKMLKQILEKSAASSGIKLETKFQYVWWHLFCFLFQGQCMRERTYHAQIIDRRPDSLLINKVDMFFMGDKFDQWAMQRAMNLDTDFSIYKKDSKEYILNFDNNKEYYQSKFKVNSGVSLQTANESCLLMDDNYNEIAPDKLLEYYNKKNDFIMFKK